MDRLEAEWDGTVDVLRLNVHDEEARPLLQELGFRFTPTFILLNGQGQEVWRSIGNIDSEIVRREIGQLP